MNGGKMDEKEETGGCIYDDAEMPQMDWNNRYDTEDYAMMELLTSFETTYGDRLDDIRGRVGKDKEIAIDIFADELLSDKFANIESKEDMLNFLHENIEL